MTNDTMIYDPSKYRYASIFQELFSCEPKKPDWKKDLEELTSKNLIVKNTDDYMKTTFQYIRLEGDKIILTGNTGNHEEPAPDEILKDDLKLKTFQFKLSCSYDDVMYDYFKTTYKEYIDTLNKIPKLIEGFMHIVPPKGLVPAHIDQEHLEENKESARTNIALSLTTPENSFTKIGGEIYYSKDNPIFAFNAQYYHSAHNYSNEDWVLLILHIPTEDIKET